ncbi:hypothetical protein [Nostoc sp. WHI]|uniref:hypothetical protein n=1 Tax=Nostoc sp. WHI TaxID=2650611 RepID=UPI0018C73BE8|nr:hypothetical protein [Nostoc sp. WHI]MBG1269973.1 hypothetical protein [Nostoc sp. WHI]
MLFILLSIVFVTVIMIFALLKNWKLRIVALSILTVLCAVIFNSVLTISFLPNLGFSNTPERSAWEKLGGWQTLFQFSCMLLGMCSKAIWDAIENREESKPIKINSWVLLKPALVSPIVFISVLQNSSLEVSTLILCFAFQNGFFWQTVLGKAEASRPKQATT